jgi:hypothetical protein
VDLVLTLWRRGRRFEQVPARNGLKNPGPKNKWKSNCVGVPHASTVPQEYPQRRVKLSADMEGASIVKLLSCLVLLALISTTAQADDDTETLYYAGAGVTDASVKHFVLNTTPGAQNAAGRVGPDISATSWKVLAGLRPLSWRWFGLEADYFGTAARTENPPLCNNCSTRSEASAIAGYLLALLPAGRYG